MKGLSVAIIGAGMGGLATAAALRRVGIDVTVYEQAQHFARVGAGIQISFNAMKVLRTFGLEPKLRAAAFYPRSWNNRDFDTGEIRFDMIFGEIAEKRYGAPYLLAHRGDLHATLANVVPDSVLRLDHQLVFFEQRADGSVRLDFANGVRADADAAVGADGVHSVVRDTLFGGDTPAFTGRVAYRTVYPATLLDGYRIDDCTKWWGPDRHIVIYYVKPDRSEVYFVTSQPEPGFSLEILVRRGRRERVARCLRWFPSAGSTRARFMSCRSQKTAGRSSSPTPLVGRQRHAVGRCLPSHDAVYGAGRGHGLRGRRRVVALSRRRGAAGSGGRLSPLRVELASLAPRGSNSVREPTPGFAIGLIRIGSTATTPGPIHWPTTRRT